MNATNLMWSAKTKTKTNIRNDELLRDLLQWLALVKSLAGIENWAQWKLIVKNQLLGLRDMLQSKLALETLLTPIKKLAPVKTCSIEKLARMMEDWTQWRLTQKSIAQIERHDPVRACSGKTSDTNEETCAGKNLLYWGTCAEEHLRWRLAGKRLCSSWETWSGEDLLCTSPLHYLKNLHR